MINLKVEVDTMEREIKRLQARISTMTAQKGIEVDDLLHSDLELIMKEMDDDVQQQYEKDSFQRLFWEQQIKSIKLKDRRQVRWHPAIIKWCLNLKLISSGAYGALRSSGVLVLPSERTLRDYTHWINPDPGFTEAVDKQLMDEAQIQTLPDFQKFVCLLFDEVRIKEDLVYDKHSSCIIGFINVGNVNNQLLKLERLQDGKGNQCIAKHLLVFMVRGLFLRLEFPYA